MGLSLDIPRIALRQILVQAQDWGLLNHIPYHRRAEKVSEVDREPRGFLKHVVGTFPGPSRPSEIVHRSENLRFALWATIEILLPMREARDT